MPETPEEEREETPQDHGHATWAGLFKEMRADEEARKLEIEQGNQDVKAPLSEKSKTLVAPELSYGELLREAAARGSGQTGKDQGLER